MKVSGMTTRLMVLALIFGKMVASTLANGQTMICMVMVFTYTRMESDMTVNTKTIKKKATDFTIGLTVGSTKAGGTRANNMDWEFTSTVQKRLRSTDYGSKAEEPAGLMISR